MISDIVLKIITKLFFTNDHTKNESRNSNNFKFWKNNIILKSLQQSFLCLPDEIQVVSSPFLLSVQILKACSAKPDHDVGRFPSTRGSVWTSVTVAIVESFFASVGIATLVSNEKRAAASLGILSLVRVTIDAVSLQRFFKLVGDVLELVGRVLENSQTSISLQGSQHRGRNKDAVANKGQHVQRR